MSCAFSMESFVEECVDRYYKVAGAPKLKDYDSPYLDVQPSEYLEAANQGDGHFKKEAASLVMSAMYMARMSRPDALTVCCELSGHLHRWSPISDKKLVHYFGYLQATKSMALHGTVAVDSVKKMYLHAFADANLAGSDTTTKSTSGGIVFATDGAYGRFPLMWASRRQGATASSTAEAELISLSDLVKSQLLPLESLWDVLRRELTTSISEEDNAACLAIVRLGYSTALRHLAKHHRVAIGTVSEIFAEAHRLLRHCPTLRQRADSLTKGLSPANNLLARALIGIANRLEDLPQEFYFYDDDNEARNFTGADS